MDKYQQTIEIFNTATDKYWDKFKDFQLCQPTYDGFIKQLPEGKKTNEGYQGSKSAAGAIYVHYHDIEQIQLQLEHMGMDILDINKLTHIHNQEPTVDVFILARKPN